jgi:hypothetical protein
MCDLRESVEIISATLQQEVIRGDTKINNIKNKKG